MDHLLLPMCLPLLWAALSSQAVDIDREVNNMCGMNKDRLKQKEYKIQTGRGLKPEVQREYRQAYVL